MKNKSGFTLIELLAVIVILALLLGVAVPSVSKYINKTRKNTYTLHEADMEVAAANKVSQCIQNNETDGCVPVEGGTLVFTLADLVEEQYSEAIKDPANTSETCELGESYVQVSNPNGDVGQLEYKVCLKCSQYETDDDCKFENPAEDAQNGVVCKLDDGDGPEIVNSVGETTVWANYDSRTISFECDDKGGCGCVKDVYTKTFTEEGYFGSIEVFDTKGNKTTRDDVEVYLDRTAPSGDLTYSCDGELKDLGNGWIRCLPKIDDDGSTTSGSVNITFTTKEDGLSGVSTWGIGLSEEPNYNKYGESSSPYKITKSGVYKVRGYIKDNAGNEKIIDDFETLKILIGDDQQADVEVSTTPTGANAYYLYSHPTDTTKKQGEIYDISHGATNGLKFNIYNEDGGVTKFQYQLNGTGEWKDACNANGGDNCDWTFEENFEGTVRFKALDSAGEMIGTESDSIQIKIDVTAPTGTLTIKDSDGNSVTTDNSASASTAKQLTVTDSDTVTITVTCETGSSGDIILDGTAQGKTSMSKVFSQGEYELKSRCIDEAGNTGNGNSASLVVEKTPTPSTEGEVVTGSSCERSGKAYCYTNTSGPTAPTFAGVTSKNSSGTLDYDFDVSVTFSPLSYNWQCYTGETVGFAWFDGSTLFGAYRCWEGSVCYNYLKSLVDSGTTTLTMSGAFTTTGNIFECGN